MNYSTIFALLLCFTLSYADAQKKNRSETLAQDHPRVLIEAVKSNQKNLGTRTELLNTNVTVNLNESKVWEHARSSLDPDSYYEVELTVSSGDPDLRIFGADIINERLIRASENPDLQPEMTTYRLSDLLINETSILIKVYGYTAAVCNLKIFQVTPTCRPDVWFDYKGGKAPENNCKITYPEGHDLSVKIGIDDPTDIYDVQLRFRDVLYVDEDPPYEFNNLESNMSPGIYPIRLTAKDYCGNILELECDVVIERVCDPSYSLMVNDEPQAPNNCRVTIAEGGSVKVRAEVDVPQDMRSMELFANNKGLIDNSYPFERTFGFEDVPPGVRQLEVRLRDECNDLHTEVCIVEIEKVCSVDFGLYVNDDLSSGSCTHSFDQGSEVMIKAELEGEDTASDLDSIVLCIGTTRSQLTAGVQENVILSDAGTVSIVVKVYDKCGNVLTKECAITVNSVCMPDHTIVFGGRDDGDGATNDLNGQALSNGKSLSSDSSQNVFLPGHNLVVTVEMDNPEDVKYVDLFIDDEFIRREKDAPFVWGDNEILDHQLSQMDPGEYQIKSRLVDNCGNTTEKERTVRIAGDPCKTDFWFVDSRIFSTCLITNPKGIFIDVKNPEMVTHVKLSLPDQEQYLVDTEDFTGWTRQEIMDHLGSDFRNNMRLQVTLLDECGNSYTKSCEWYGFGHLQDPPPAQKMTDTLYFCIDEPNRPATNRDKDRGQFTLQVRRSFFKSPGTSAQKALNDLSTGLVWSPVGGLRLNEELYYKYTQSGNDLTVIVDVKSKSGVKEVRMVLPGCLLSSDRLKEECIKDVLDDLTCAPGFVRIGDECIAQSTLKLNPVSQCPLGGTEDSAGNCRKPATDAGLRTTQQKSINLDPEDENGDHPEEETQIVERVDRWEVTFEAPFDDIDFSEDIDVETETESETDGDAEGDPDVEVDTETEGDPDTEGGDGSNTDVETDPDTETDVDVDPDEDDNVHPEPEPQNPPPDFDDDIGPEESIFGMAVIEFEIDAEVEPQDPEVEGELGKTSTHKNEETLTVVHNYPFLILPNPCVADMRTAYNGQESKGTDCTYTFPQGHDLSLTVGSTVEDGFPFVSLNYRGQTYQPDSLPFTWTDIDENMVPGTYQVAWTAITFCGDTITRSCEIIIESTLCEADLWFEYNGKLVPDTLCEMTVREGDFLQVTAGVGNPHKVNGVRFFFEGQEWTDDTYPFNLFIPTEDLSPGDYPIRAVVEDMMGNLVEKQCIITVTGCQVTHEEGDDLTIRVGGDWSDVKHAILNLGNAVYADSLIPFEWTAAADTLPAGNYPIELTVVDICGDTTVNECLLVIEEMSCDQEIWFDYNGERAGGDNCAMVYPEGHDLNVWLLGEDQADINQVTFIYRDLAFVDVEFPFIWENVEQNMAIGEHKLLAIVADKCNGTTVLECQIKVEEKMCDDENWLEVYHEEPTLVVGGVQTENSPALLILDEEEEMDSPASKVRSTSEESPSVAPDRLNNNVSASGSPASPHLVLKQNQPNPFDRLTTIRFYNPQDAEIELSVYSLGGERVHNQTEFFKKGWQEADIRYADLGAAGVYFYEVSNGIETARMKMVFME